MGLVGGKTESARDFGPYAENEGEDQITRYFVDSSKSMQDDQLIFVA